MNSIELFAGAGGLAMGMAKAGFHHCGLVEWNPYACQTIQENPKQYSDAAGTWTLFEGDARNVDYKTMGRDIAVVSGGPPCQPFSMGGKHRGSEDDRDMFPEAVRAIREVQPKAFIFENVKGLLRENFSSYLKYVRLQLTYPLITRLVGESVEHHLTRLEQHEDVASERTELIYDVYVRLLNAANYGVPQKRERVFIVGFQRNLEVKWHYPSATHSEEALLRSKWITGEYWERHGIPPDARPTPSAKLATRVAKIASTGLGKDTMPWVTVRDELAGLPDPIQEPNNSFLNHIYIPGARSYPGHTGSPLDEPSKTLKAGDHGVPGGENMIALPNGQVRYFTIREAARIQTFPDDYVFHGSWGQIMKQLGNAVPVRLAEVVAREVAKHLKNISLNDEVTRALPLADALAVIEV